MKSPEDETNASGGHWRLLRDLLGFQWKLLLDGLRDLFLVPVSIGAAILGFVTSPANPGVYFDALMKLGHRSDRWINLFGTQDDDSPSADQVVARVEDILRREYEKGGMVKSAKEHTDDLIRRIRKEI